MKKWLVVVTTIFALLVPFAGGVFANGPVPIEELDTIFGEGHGIRDYDYMLENGTYDNYYYLTVNDVPYVVNTNGTNYRVTYIEGKHYMHFYDKAGNKVAFMVVRPNDGVVQYTGSSKGLQVSGNSVDLKKKFPVMPIAQNKGLETIPETILTTLGAGGLIGLGLMILGVMLAVSLVPRLIRLFHR